MVEKSEPFAAASNRSLDATKWNRGPQQPAHHRVGDSFDGRRRWVMVEKSEPFAAAIGKRGLLLGWVSSIPLRSIEATLAEAPSRQVIAIGVCAPISS